MKLALALVIGCTTLGLDGITVAAVIERFHDDPNHRRQLFDKGTTMDTIKDSEIYPKFTFRISPEEKEWLNTELQGLKEKFNAESLGKHPVITKNVLLIAALKRGISYLSQLKPISDTEIFKAQILPARPQLVWEVLTSPKHLAQWWQKDMKLEPRLGGEFFEPWHDAEGGGHLGSGQVKAIKSGTYIEFTWREQEWELGQETICSFELLAADGQTFLELRHRGWEAFPQQRGSDLQQGFSGGWDELMLRLKNYVATLEMAASDQ